MAVMTATSVRHLPAVEDAKLVGIVSFGDMVKSIIDCDRPTGQGCVTLLQAAPPVSAR